MATIIRQFTKSVPAGTAQATPVSLGISFPTEQVLSVDLEVPPGPAGLMGFYLAISGQQVIPFETGEWIVWDDVRASWPLDDYPVTGAWSLVAYNTDIFAHEIIVRFHDQPAVPGSLATISSGITIVNSSDPASFTIPL